MSTILGTPTMPRNATTDRYVLSIKPTVQAPPRDGLARLERVLAKREWTQSDRDRMERAANGLREHSCRWLSEDCQRCNLADRIDMDVREWDRIRQSPPIPSTAQLRNALRRPDRTVRAARLYRDLMERSSARRRIVLASVKQFKTPSVQYKHERRAEESDPALRRLGRAMDRLRRIQPDVASLARTVH